jgi:hypothetical protein
MDNFVSQGEAKEHSTRSCNVCIIRFDETEGETTQQLLDKVNSQVLQGQMKLAIKAVVAMRQPISRRAETKPGIVHTRDVLDTFATVEDRKVVFQNRVVLKGTHWGLEEDLTKQQQEQKSASWHLFEKAKVEKKKTYWRGVDLYINDTIRGSTLGVLGPESITSLPVEHPWGDKHEAKYQFTYTETI